MAKDAAVAESLAHQAWDEPDFVSDSIEEENSMERWWVLVLCHPVIEIVEPYAESARQHINKSLQHLEPWQILFFGIGTTLIAVSVWRFLFKPDKTLWSRLKKSVFRIARSLPILSGNIQKKLDDQAAEMEASFHGKLQGQKYVERLPSKGLTKDEVLAELVQYKKLADVKWSEGACSGTVYSGDEKLTELIAKVYADFAWSNPLHPAVFPDVRKMEAEVVRMVCNMFNGGPESCGAMTSGGTESIIMACKAYRDRAYSLGIENPEMIIPETAHAAFDKAAGYLCMKLTHIPVNAETRQVDIAAMKRAISKRTCMHGVLDPIVEIAQLGKKYGIPVHVDSCLGGFLVPFMRKAGFNIEPFDFTVDGVTSISADTHKYGFAPKGSSVILYRSKAYRQFQYFVATDWPGGIYASPSISGSRAGAIIAACWATMMHIGEEGYVDSTRRIIETSRFIEEELRKVKGVFVYGKPATSVVAVGSDTFNIYRLSDALLAKGWHMSALQFPSSIHLCVTLVHTKSGIAQRFVDDFTSCTAEIMKDPKQKDSGSAAIYGLAQSIPDRSIVSEIASGFFDGYYSTTDRTAAAGSKLKSANGKK